MNNSTLIISLAVVTLVLVVGYLVIQLFKTDKAKKEHHHSAVTKGKPELRDG